MANNNNNKDGQNRAGRDSNTQNQANQAGRSGSQSQGQSHGRSGAMSPEEAGRLGGEAPHSCRGFECQQQGHKSKNSDNE